jgi:peptide/nickel transport system substrate-binding protein
VSSWRDTGARLTSIAFLACAAALPLHAQKVLRYAFPVAETSADPAKVSDIYSGFVISAIFDTPLDYDYLARPLKLKPLTLTSMPEISADGLTYTMHVKPGVYFSDDPAFNGKKRELVAEDFVYSIKRMLDPKVASPLLGEIEGKIVGTDEALARARKANKFDYDAPIEGLKALDRYTWRIKLTEPFFVFIYNLADCRFACAVAREVVEKYGDDFGSHPVGTGPYRMAFWKRSSRMVFEKNPNYRDETWDAEPAPNDARGQAMKAKFEGRKLPMIDRIEVNIIEETQPRWLAFLNGEFDLMYGLPEEYANQAIPNNKLAPNLRKRGMQMEQTTNLDLTFTYFNMEDPVVGGYTPEKVALRRAISLGYQTRNEIAVLRKNLAIPAETPYSPGVAGYEPGFRTGANEYSPAKAKALLDMFGYVDRDGDGYREMPDGAPLVIQANSSPTAVDQQYDELWKRSMDDIGVRITFRKAKWPDLLKESNAGKLMVWRLGGSAAAPDADTWLQTLYSPNAGQKGNRSRFRNAEYDRIYEKARLLPDGPERTKLYEELAKICVAYAPYKVHVHRIATDIWYPWVEGYRRLPIIGNHFWKYLDVDPR